MVVIRAYHGTRKEYLPSILKTGLEPRKTSDYHYSFLTDQPKGIYVALNPDPTRWWWGEVRLEIMYCGPIVPDPELAKSNWSGQAHVLLDPVPKDWIRPLEFDEYQQMVADYVQPPEPTAKPAAQAKAKTEWIF